MEHPNSLIFAFLTVILILLDGLGWSHGCVDQEREALLLLKPFFKYLDWPVNLDYCCEWKMVMCNATTGRITKLSLNGGAKDHQLWYLNTSYFLPFEQLTGLDLTLNSLAGFVENQGFETLSLRLTNLEELYLRANHFNDSIISSLSGFSHLRFLDLSLNKMETTLNTNGFESLWQLSNLELLDLSGNNFNNNIMPALRGLSSLKHLNLSRNKLSGTIDMEGDLEFLDLSQNFFNNSIFGSLNGLSRLKSLDLSGNQLTGSVHLKELAGLRNLVELQLNENNIEEIVGPQDKTILNKLKVLSLRTNGKGLVLKSLGALSTLRTIDLAKNILNETNSFQDLFHLSALEELFLDGSILHKDFLPSHVGSITSLKVLHLSSCGLKGTLPDRGWCDLKNLEELDLRENELEGALPPCMANLSSLRTLLLGDNQFTGNIASTPIPNLKSIEILSLGSNHFEISLKSFTNHSSLKVFVAHDGNQLIEEAASQPWTSKFQLEVLSLSNCIPNNSNIATSLKFLYHQFNLRYLDLSHSKFGGRFPNWLFENNTRLEEIHLADNSFEGPFQFPSQPNLDMSWIDLSHNKFEGEIPSNISLIFPDLFTLNLSKNSFQGTIPASFGEMESLTSLDLSNNQFSGELEEKQFANSPLLSLKLSNNNLSGHIPTIFNPYSLAVLQLDGNNFVGEMPDLSSLGYIQILDISHNSLSGKLPRWIVNMSNLRTLGLSNNRFEGSIPPEFCKLYHLAFLDLSGNNLSESLPPCFSELTNLEHLLLRRNKLSGSMTQSFLNMIDLVTLDIGENNFSGILPNWIQNLSRLGILVLRGNQFHGDIPIQLCNLTRLNILDLSSNRLSGRLPPCLSHFSFAMGFNLSQSLDIDVVGEYVQWSNFNLIIGSILKGVVEFTSKRNSLNYTGGYILDHMYGIDLSRNQFSGEIPPEFGNLCNLRALNLSHNNLNGSIPASFSKLKQLESLDLSYNNLNGRIPPQLTEVHTLEVFSVSHNNLSGQLPDFKAQFATFSDSSYEGNSFLCGPPLNNTCDETHFASPSKEESEDNGFMDMTFFWVTFVVTYTVALFGVVIVLYINSSWRHAWFYRIDVCFNTCYYFLVDKFQ